MVDDCIETRVYEIMKKALSNLKGENHE